MKIPALIMLGPPGSSELEYLVSEGKRCAAMDLVQRLQQLESVDPVYVFTADEAFASPLREMGAVIKHDSTAVFHFGSRLRICIDDVAGESQRIAYFGAASAPLLSAAWMEQIIDRLQQAERPWACVNNYYSTDWAVINHASLLGAADQHIPSDNSLGWVARNICGYEIHTVASSAASRADLDTPTDLVMLSGHPGLGPHLKVWLDKNSEADLSAVQSIRSLLQTPARTLALIGRVSSEASRRLEQSTQIWTRIFAEERGMSASGRQARGEVFSLVGRMLADWGPERFIHELEQSADGALWDTRVVMAHLFNWPSAQDRFAFDLGRSDMLKDRSLAAWCDAVHGSRIPLITGGHNVVSGGLMALLETAFPEIIPPFNLIRAV